MEVNLDRSSEFGINLHSGYALGAPAGLTPAGVESQLPGLFATKYNKQPGLPEGRRSLDRLWPSRGPTRPTRLPELSGQYPRWPGTPIDDFRAQHELRVLSPPVGRRADQRSLEIHRFRDELACRERAIRLDTGH